MDAESGRSLVEAFPGRRVAVVGDIYLDEYVRCRAAGVSPEMPVLRVVEERIDHAAGAAGNIAANARGLGAEVLLAGVVGEDDPGRRLEELAEQAGIETSALLKTPNRRTGVFSRVLLVGESGSEQHQIRVDREQRVPVTDEQRERLLAAIEAWLPRQGGAIVLADYDETDERFGLVTRSFTAALVGLAGRKDALLAATSRRHAGELQDVEHLFVNRAEAERSRGGDVTADPLRSAQVVRERGRHRYVTLTLGGEGAVVATPEDAFRVEAAEGRVVDPCGAGDALLATTVLSRLAGAEIRTAARLAAHAAALAVSRPGTHAVTGPELVARVRFGGAGAGKLFDPDTLADVLEARRGSGRIVFTNGYFDLFHSGHVELLRQARALGDLLVVALNSDRSTRENKGDGRPVLDERERVEILSSLEIVDYVTVFDELTPINVIRRIRPDVIVKGGSYRPEEVVGKDLVESYGGRVVVIPYAGRVTTEKLIRSIKAASDGTRHE